MRDVLLNALLGWGIGTVVVLAVSLMILAVENSGRRDKVIAARGVLLCWAWPALALYGLLLAARYVWETSEFKTNK